MVDSEYDESNNRSHDEDDHESTDLDPVRGIWLAVCVSAAWWILLEQLAKLGALLFD